MKYLCFVFSLFIVRVVQAQTTQWTLQQCIEYAIQNNIQLKQSDLNIKLASIQEEQNKYAQYPSLNADLNNGLSFGRSIDPTSNQFVNQAYYFNGVNVNSSVLLFGWFQKKYAIEQSSIETKAVTEQYKQLQNDISLNIATAYLRILLAKSQVGVALSQLETDNEQLRQTRLRVDAGQLPELNVAQMLAQVATDSSTYVSANSDVIQSILDLKAILNWDMQKPFDVLLPNIDEDVFANVLEYGSAEEVYAMALHSQYTIAYNGLKIKSAEKQLQITQATKLPQISASWNAGTNYASSFKQISNYTYKGEETIGSFSFMDSVINITRPSYNFTYENVPYFKQLDNNFRQTVAVGISVPIFNNYSVKYNIERGKINIQNLQYIDEQSKLKLKQDVYKAYTDAKNSYQKYIAAKRNEETAKVAYTLGAKRYSVGMTNTFEYTSLQNNLTRAKANTNSTKYDYIFKTKILDYYAGKKLVL